jgi:hypothetical protein
MTTEPTTAPDRALVRLVAIPEPQSGSVLVVGPATVESGESKWAVLPGERSLFFVRESKNDLDFWVREVEVEGHVKPAPRGYACTGCDFTVELAAGSPLNPDSTESCPRCAGELVEYEPGCDVVYHCETCLASHYVSPANLHKPGYSTCTSCDGKLARLVSGEIEPAPPRPLGVADKLERALVLIAEAAEALGVRSVTLQAWPAGTFEVSPDEDRPASYAGGLSLQLHPADRDSGLVRAPECHDPREVAVALMTKLRDKVAPYEAVARKLESL